MVKFWNSKDEIGKHVLSAMVAATNFFHPVGWVRSNRIANDDALNEIITLKKENERLKQKLKKLEEQVSVAHENLAPLESEFMINGEGEMLTPDNYERTLREFSIVKSWESMFRHLAQQLRSQKDYSDITRLIHNMVWDDVKKVFSEKHAECGRLTGIVFSETHIETIIAQLSAHGLLKCSARNGRRGYILSDLGEKKFTEQYLVETKKQTKPIEKK
jgi:hypothetical protein